MNPEAFRQSPSGRVIKAQSGYWAFVPNPLPPPLEWTPGLIARLSDADRALGELAGLGRSLLNPHLLIMPFVRREAVLSSRIEGTQASLSDLYAYEAAQPPKAEPATGLREVANYVRAMEYARDRLQSLPLSLRLIREIHAKLMEGVRGEHQTPGEFRRSQSWIGPPGCVLNDATFVPPPVTEMHQALDAFERFLYTEPSLPPLIRLGLIHYQFETIHPFMDGNGRIGRLLVTMLMTAWDLLPGPLLYLSAFFEAHRQAYYDLLLAVSERGAWQEWLAFFLRGVASQALDGVARSRRLQDLREQYRGRFQTTRASARLLKAVDFLFARPVLAVRQLSEALVIPRDAAHRYVNRLEEAGILREMTGRGRNRLYVADEVIEAIQAPVQPTADAARGEAQ